MDCSVCQNRLVSPTTLSCGYTVCQPCLPTLGQSSFKCPVTSCEREKHLFGPEINRDVTVQAFLDDPQAILQCTIGGHPLRDPITNHCGHTFCKTCLLQHRISNNTCLECEKRLPSYSFIQQQPANLALQSILPSKTTLEMAVYKDIPTLSLDFPLLPSQKCLIPIPSLRDLIIPCQNFLALAVQCQSKTGTLAKILSIEPNGHVLIVGIYRFQKIDTCIEILEERSAQPQDIQLAQHITNFMIQLSHSRPSQSFCNTLQGLLGPVWFESVQRSHGPLPEDPVLVCWWAAVVLPVGISDRTRLLNTCDLTDRLAIVVSWIHELESQWDNCTERVMKSVAKVGK